jgi:hypothetical protein
LKQGATVFETPNLSVRHHAGRAFLKGKAMSLCRWSAVPLVCLALIAVTPGRANDIRFDQSNPTIVTLNIRQSGVDHAVHGLAEGSSVPDPTAGATLKGNFGTVSLQQSSPGGSDIALRVEVGTAAPSDIFITLSGGAHSVALNAASERLTSLINLEGAPGPSPLPSL